MAILSGILFIILILLFGALLVAYMGASFYGIYLSFKKKWYIGAVSLLVPGFPLIVGLYKLITKKDLLK